MTLKHIEKLETSIVHLKGISGLMAVPKDKLYDVPIESLETITDFLDEIANDLNTLLLDIKNDPDDGFIR